jgi:hypothetical protein
MMSFVNLNYDLKCECVKRGLARDFPDDHFSYGRTNFEHKMRVIVNGNACFTILDDHSWDEIKRCVERKKNQTLEGCMICFNDDQKLVTCNRCCNGVCIKCYINDFKINNGILTCAFCRNKVGIHCPPERMHACIQEIIVKGLFSGQLKDDDPELDDLLKCNQ